MAEQSAISAAISGPRKSKRRNREKGAAGLVEIVCQSDLLGFLVQPALCALRGTCRALRGAIAERSGVIRSTFAVTNSTINRCTPALASAFPFVRRICLDARPDSFDAGCPPTPTVVRAQLESNLIRLAALSEVAELGVVGAYDVAAFLPQMGAFRFLRSLVVECLGWDHQAADLHRPPSRTLGALEELAVSYSGGNIFLAEALRAAPALRVLEVRPAQYDDEDDDSRYGESRRMLCYDIASAVGLLPRLSHFHLECPMDDGALCALSTELGGLRLLEVIAISETGPPARTHGGIGERGACAIAAVIPRFKSLRRLTLGSYWGMGDGGVAAIASALECTPLLESLDLSLLAKGFGHADANVPGDDGVCCLVKALLLHTPLLRRLCLDGVRLGDSGAAALAGLLVQRPRMELASLASGIDGVSCPMVPALTAALHPCGPGALPALATLAVSVAWSTDAEALARLRALAACVRDAMPALQELTVHHTLAFTAAVRVRALFPHGLQLALVNPEES